MKNASSLFLLLSGLNPFAQEAVKPVEITPPVAITQAQVLPNVVKPKIAVFSFASNFDTTPLMFDFVEAAKNKEIAGILLNIDSNGGEFSRFSPIHDLIKNIRKKKPVVGLIVGNALSCGYLVASATDYLIAHSMSFIGSIGAARFYDKYRDAKITGNVEAMLDVEIFTAGKHKATGSPYREFSDEEKKYIQNDIETAYQLFKEKIAENKKLDLNNSQEWAEANDFYSPEALKLGLIDEIGTIFEAEAKLIELLRKKNPDIVYDNECEFVHYGQQAQAQ